MKPHLHARNSAREWGGKPDDYQAIHDFVDSSKAHVPDISHRAILHSSFGCYLAEQVFGILLTNSDGKHISVRDIVEKHIIEDLGFIPTVQDYLRHMEIAPWMSGTKRGGQGKTKHIPLVD